MSKVGRNLPLNTLLEQIESGHSLPSGSRESDRRRHVHSLIHYPAMMVPSFQSDVIRACASVRPEIRTVYDPFVGSGTTLTESMLLGLDFFGQDINPLAILICRVKSACRNTSKLSVSVDSAIERAERDSSNTVETCFPGLDKWFEPKAVVQLARIRRSIEVIESQSTRRFLWVALAETVRLTSNSRTSTAKLHLRPKAEIGRRPLPLEVFRACCERNIASLAAFMRLLDESGRLKYGRYSGRYSLRCQDSRLGGPASADLLVTSPPYGDNHTTVAYGQASYLALHWINHPDVVSNTDQRFLSAIRAIDSASLGGSWGESMDCAGLLIQRSPSFERTWELLDDRPRDRRLRVASYFHDLLESLDRILPVIDPGGLMCWTVADRTVGGVRVPLTSILIDFIGNRAELIGAIKRQIPPSRKTMPTRNRSALTIGTESTLVFERS